MPWNQFAASSRTRSKKIDTMKSFVQITFREDEKSGKVEKTFCDIPDSSSRTSEYGQSDDWQGAGVDKPTSAFLFSQAYHWHSVIVFEVPSRMRRWSAGTCGCNAAETRQQRERKLRTTPLRVFSSLLRFLLFSFHVVLSLTSKHVGMGLPYQGRHLNPAPLCPVHST